MSDQRDTGSGDALLDCLVIFAKRYHRPVSAEALVVGLPVSPGRTTPELFSVESSKGMFSRVSARAGLAARLIKRDLDHLSGLLLPCILILHQRGACILEQIDREKGQAKVILSEVGEGEQWISLDELRENYLGFAFLLKPEYQSEARQHRMLDVRKGHWFWGTLRRSREMYVSIILASAMVNLFALATPLFTMNVYDRVVPNQTTDTLWVLAVGVLTVYLFDALLKFIRNYLLEVAGKKSDVIMSSVLFEQSLNLRMENWPKSVGVFSNTLNQFESIRGFFASSTIVTLVDLPFSILFLVVIAYISDALVAVPLITIAILLIYALIITRPLRASIQDTYAASAQKSSLLVETLSSIQTLKTLGASRYAQWAWEESTGHIAGQALRTRLLSGSIGIVTAAVTQLNMVAVVVLGVYAIIDLELTMGGLIATVILSSRAVAPMAQVAGLITTYQQTRSAYQSLEALMQEEVERPDDHTYVRQPEFRGGFEFKDAQFSYPEAEAETLRGINLKVTPGEKVGIIGRVGSGKTTLAKLLLGLYRLSGGNLTVDSLEIGQIDPADLRRSISYLSQDIELMRGTIRDNITAKNPGATDEDILAAAHVAGVDIFANKMPRGYDTMLGERGSGLSGGQRQSVALARTLLLQEQLIVLDEPTNSMDNATEALIRKRLFTYTRDKTLVLVTHKAPMLELVDRLVVIEAGKVVMDGTRADVLRRLKEGGNSIEAQG